MFLRHSLSGDRPAAGKSASTTPQVYGRHMRLYPSQTSSSLFQQIPFFLLPRCHLKPEEMVKGNECPITISSLFCSQWCAGMVNLWWLQKAPLPFPEIVPLQSAYDHVILRIVQEDEDSNCKEPWRSSNHYCTQVLNKDDYIEMYPTDPASVTDGRF
jgi:hypothetical protein